MKSKKTIDQLLMECDSNKSCAKCSNYMDCITRFKVTKLTSESNNPTTLNAEIRSFDFDIFKEKEDKETYKIDISEANQTVINKALISLFQIKNNPEISVIKSALEKFSVDPNNSAEIFKSKDDNRYHLVFECVDCTAINDSTEYINGDSITIYCKYCGKRHKFNINKEN